jgi:hypothetical protein
MKRAVAVAIVAHTARNASIDVSLRRFPPKVSLPATHAVEDAGPAGRDDDVSARSYSPPVALLGFTYDTAGTSVGRFRTTPTLMPETLRTPTPKIRASADPLTRCPLDQWPTW